MTKKSRKPIISNASTIPYGSASRVWCVRRWHSLKSWPITSAPSSSSDVVTTSQGPQHYLDNTTEQRVKGKQNLGRDVSGVRWAHRVATCAGGSRRHSRPLPARCVMMRVFLGLASLP
jgi:hypothetical protein